MTDQQLLQRYYGQRDHDAFTQIVSRHGRMVYATARRLTPADAEDIAQAVFTLLAQKAGSLGSAPSVAGWLYQATRYCARNALKLRQRREHYEREAAAMRSETSQGDGRELQEVLDNGLAAIGEGYRQVLLLRYLEGLSLEETADRLAISVPAVAKRTERGLEKLRKALGPRGQGMSATAVGAVVAQEALRELPEGLMQKLAGVSAGSAGSTIEALAAGAKKGFVMAEIVAIAKVAAVVAVLAGGAGLTAAGVARTSQSGQIVNEADPAAPGTVRLVRAKLWVDEKVASAIRAAGKPVQTKSQWFEAMLVPNDALHRAMAPIRQASSQPQVHMEGLFSGEPKRIWEGYGPPPMGNGFARNRSLVASIRAGQGGKHDLQVRAGGLAMQLDMPGLIAAYLAPTGPYETPAAIAFDGEVPGGMALVFMGGFENEGVYCVDAWEAVRMTRAQAETLRGMSPNGGEWFRRTPTEWRSYAERMSVWQSRGKQLENADRLTQQVDAGVEAQLLAISRPGKWPGCWWTPKGEPIRNAAGEPVDVKLAVVVRRVTGPEKVDERMRRLYKWGGAGVTDRGQDHQEQVFGMPEEGGPLRLEVAGSDWRRLGVVDEQHPLSANGTDVEVKEVRMADTICTILIRYTDLPDAPARLVALDGGGQELGSTDIGEPLREGDVARSARSSEQYCVIMDIKSKPAQFAVELATYRKVEFSGYATVPVVLPAETVSVQQAEKSQDDQRVQEALKQWEAAKRKYDAVVADDTTPQGLYKRMLDAAAGGRREEIVGCFVTAKDDGERKAVEAIAEMMQAAVRCNQTAIGEFGLEALVRGQVRLPGATRYELMIYDWRVNGENAKGQGQTMRRVDGQWRIEMAGYAAMAKDARAMVEGMNRLREKMERGEIRTVEELRAEVEKGLGR